MVATHEVKQQDAEQRLGWRVRLAIAIAWLFCPAGWHIHKDPTRTAKSKRDAQLDLVEQLEEERPSGLVASGTLFEAAGASSMHATIETPSSVTTTRPIGVDLPAAAASVPDLHAGVFDEEHPYPWEFGKTPERVLDQP